MKNNKLLLLFAVVAIIQLATPLYMAWHWEDILQTGQRFYWVTAPVDPYDPFKGRYIDLRFSANTAPLIHNQQFDYGQTAYALIAEDATGKAFISSVSATPPAAGPYVKVKIAYVQDQTAHIELPFKRYYLPEQLAPAAETAYHNNAGQNIVAAVRLKDGYGVIEQLYIGDMTLTDYLNSAAQ